jgi:diadenosine tetraphosphate (Ap4A) HIT family hydrolase
MSNEWMPREKWDALVRGEGCELCELMAEKPEVNDYGVTVAELDASLLRLMFNQYAPGYSVLVAKRHVREPYELSQQERGQYFEDLMRAALALETVYGAIKMNFQILGNLAPHLHCHIVPRYYGDDAPNSPLDPWKEQRMLSLNEMMERVVAIRAALE